MFMKSGHFRHINSAGDATLDERSSAGVMLALVIRGEEKEIARNKRGMK
jgi:hypothetical protein